MMTLSASWIIRLGHTPVSSTFTGPVTAPHPRSIEKGRYRFTDYLRLGIPMKPGRGHNDCGLGGLTRSRMTLSVRADDVDFVDDFGHARGVAGGVQDVVGHGGVGDLAGQGDLPAVDGHVDG